jgi:hypothetical protein
MRKFVCAAFVLLVGITFVVGGEFAATITKIEDGKTVHFKKGKKGNVVEGKLPLAASVKVVKGVFNKDTKKVDAGDAIADGVKSDTFTKAEKGVAVFLITEGEGDAEKIVEIRVTGKKKKAAN